MVRKTCATNRFCTDSSITVFSSLRWDQDLESQRHAFGHDQRAAPLDARVGSNYAPIRITRNRRLDPHWLRILERHHVAHSHGPHSRCSHSLVLLPHPTRLPTHAPLREDSETILERMRPTHERRSDLSNPISHHTITSDQQKVLSQPVAITCPHPRRSRNRALDSPSCWNKNRREAHQLNCETRRSSPHNARCRGQITRTLSTISFSLGWHDVHTPNDVNDDEHRHKNCHEHSNSNYQSLHLILLAWKS